MPTDTFYGLAVDPVNLRAVESIYEIKSRVKQKPLSLLVAGLAQAYQLARESGMCFDLLAERFWPGPLTVIVKASSRLPLRSTANTGNVALRVPDAAIPRAVVAALGLPITATCRQPGGAAGVYLRGVRARPDRRQDSADRGRRADGTQRADDHRGPFRAGWDVADFAGRGDSDARDCACAAGAMIVPKDNLRPARRVGWTAARAEPGTGPVVDCGGCGCRCAGVGALGECADSGPTHVAMRHGPRMRSRCSARRNMTGGRRRCCGRGWITRWISTGGDWRR